MLNRVQKFSFEDQRGPINSSNLKVPDFLLTNNLIQKSQSLSRNINTSKPTTPQKTYNDSYNMNNSSIKSYGNSLHGTQSFTYDRSHHKNLKKNNLMTTFNESTSSLPVINATKNMPNNIFLGTDFSNEQKSTFIKSGSRSPMIVYDNDDEKNLNRNWIENMNKNLDNSGIIDESCLIENSTSKDYDKSMQSLNNTNLSSSFFYENDRDRNVIIEEGEDDGENELENNIISQSDSLRMNNSILSLTYSPTHCLNIQSESSFQRSAVINENNKVNSRISYV